MFGRNRAELFDAHLHEEAGVPRGDDRTASGEVISLVRVGSVIALLGWMPALDDGEEVPARLVGERIDLDRIGDVVDEVDDERDVDER